MAATAQKRLERPQRRGGDIVLDALGVGLRRLARRADGDQQIDDEPVPLMHAFGHRGASLGQKYSAIGLRSREPLAFQAGDRLAGGGVGDAKPPRDIRCARFAIGRDQIGDQFGVILERRGRARGARLAEAVGLRGLGRKFRGRRRRPLLRFLVTKPPSLNPARNIISVASTMQPWLQIATSFFARRSDQALAPFCSLLTMA